MRRDGLVYLAHEPLGFQQSPDDAAIFLPLVVTKRATDAVFEPLLRKLNFVPQINIH